MSHVRTTTLCCIPSFPNVSFSFCIYFIHTHTWTVFFFPFLLVAQCWLEQCQFSQFTDINISCQLAPKIFLWISLSLGITKLSETPKRSIMIFSKNCFLRAFLSFFFFWILWLTCTTLMKTPKKKKNLEWVLVPKLLYLLFRNLWKILTNNNSQWETKHYFIQHWKSTSYINAMLCYKSYLVKYGRGQSLQPCFLFLPS